MPTEIKKVEEPVTRTSSVEVKKKLLLQAMILPSTGLLVAPPQPLTEEEKKVQKAALIKAKQLMRDTGLPEGVEL